MRKIALYSLPLQIILYAYLRTKTSWIESSFIPYVFQPLSAILRHISSIFPFSTGLLSIYLIGIYLLYKLFSQGKLGFKRFLREIPVWLAPILFFYQITWGLLYYRMPVSQLMGYSTETPTVDELRSLCEDLVKETNALRRQFSDDTLQNITSEKVFENAPSYYENLNLPFLKYRIPSIKKATGSALLAYMGTSGIYTFWSGEANVNKINIDVDLPAVTLHEMAHQMGFASEDEANYLAWLAGRNSGDAVTAYSANYHVIWRALARLSNVDSTSSKILYKTLDSAVYRDAHRDHLAWKSYRNPLQQFLIAPIYDLFLKANGREYGIMSYDQVIDLMIFERRKLTNLPKDS